VCAGVSVVFVVRLAEDGVGETTELLLVVEEGVTIVVKGCVITGDVDDKIDVPCPQPARRAENTNNISAPVVNLFFCILLFVNPF
jgi:hypothetical protein